MLSHIPLFATPWTVANQVPLFWLLAIPINEKHHVYADHYEEIEPKVEVVDGYEFKTRQFKWIPPKYIGEE